MNKELIKINLDKSIKKYKIQYLLDDILKKEINKYLSNKSSDGKKYFYMNAPFFEKENYSNGSYTLNYEYNHLLERDLYFYLPLTKYKTLKCLLMSKQDNYDDLFDTLFDNIILYKEKIINFLDNYISKVDLLFNELKGKEFSLFETDFSPFLNKKIPNEYKIKNINYSMYDNALIITVLNKETLDEVRRFFSLTDNNNEVYSVDILLKKIKEEMKEVCLKDIKKFIKKEYFNHVIFNNFKISFDKLNVEDIFELKDYTFKINLEKSLEGFLNDILYAKNTVWFKKYLKKHYYKMLEKQNFFNDTVIRIKYINFIDNYIKEIKFTKNNELADGLTIFYTNKFYNLDKLAQLILDNAKTKI